jgi:hypothetical protein
VALTDLEDKKPLNDNEDIRDRALHAPIDWHGA